MRTYFILLLTVFSMNSIAQSTGTAPGDSIPWELRKQSFIYSTANRFNDPLVARVALYSLLAENPTNIAVYDTLAYSYFSYGQYASAALVSQQALQVNPEDGFALDIAANSFDRLGVRDKAINFYEKIYLKEENPTILYKISFLEMELERYAEAVESTDEIISNPESKEIRISFPMISKENQTQEVPLDVAAHRVKAMIEESKGNIEGAKTKYVEVLTMYPGFEIVQQQIRDLGKSD